MRRGIVAAAWLAACAPEIVRVVEPDARVSTDVVAPISLDVPGLDVPDAAAAMDAAMEPDVPTTSTDVPRADAPPTDRVTGVDAPLLLDAPPDCGRELTTCCEGTLCLPGLRCVETRCVQDPTCGELQRTCCGGTRCDPGLRCEAGRCVGDSCVAIGAPCRDTDTCCAGRVCRPSPTNRTCCTEVDGPCTGPGECCGAAVCTAGRCVGG
ncbi:MAG: hypothetical protein U0325_05300 [Polyangiales bacterium]